MKLVKTSSGNTRIKMSKTEWQSIGKKAGWLKKANDAWSQMLKNETRRDWTDDPLLKNIALGENYNIVEAEISKMVDEYIRKVGGEEIEYRDSRSRESQDSDIYQEYLQDKKDFERNYFTGSLEYFSKIQEFLEDSSYTPEQIENLENCFKDYRITGDDLYDDGRGGGDNDYHFD